MSTQLQQYQFNTHQFRVIPDEQGEPWFIAKDVCSILGYKNASKALKDHCRKSGVTNSYTPALSNTYNLIDEGNLYRLIIKSNKPQSEPFENWVCDEVLPAIRKTGNYQAQPLLAADEITEKAALQTQNTQLQAELAQQAEMLALYRFKADALEQQVKPKPKRQSRGALTQNEINAIHTLHAQGLSITAVAKQIGRSTASVSYVLRGAKAGAA